MSTGAISRPSATSSATSSRRSPTDMAGRAPRQALRPTADGGDRRDRFAVVAGRFNEAISKKLLDGALAALEGHGTARESVDVYWVPGSFELPQAAKALASGGRYAAVVCVGAVIKGA